MSYFDDTENFDAELLKVMDSQEEQNILKMLADLFNRYVKVYNENDILKNKVKVLETSLKDVKNGKNNFRN